VFEKMGLHIRGDYPGDQVDRKIVTIFNMGVAAAGLKSS